MHRLGGMSGSQSQPLTAYLWPAYGRQLLRTKERRSKLLILDGRRS